MVATAVGITGRKAHDLSRAEELWQKNGPEHLVTLDEFRGTTVVANLFEWCTFLLPGGRYTPDFMVLLSDGRVVFVEVKASKYQGSYRDSRAKLRACASLNPWFYYVMAEAVFKTKSWKLSVVPPDEKGWINGVFVGGQDA